MAARFGASSLHSGMVHGQAFPLPSWGARISGSWDRDRLTQQVIPACPDAAYDTRGGEAPDRAAAQSVE
jgi:hypothetical protein